MNNLIPLLRPILFWTILVVFLVFLSCCTNTPKVKYYSLVDQKNVNPVASQNNSLIISIGPVTIADILDHSQIATEREDGVYTRSEYHRWSGNVDREIARALAEQLSLALHTEKVIIFAEDPYLQPDCRVLIDVLALDGTLDKDADLSVRWTLIDPKDQKAPLVGRNQINRRPEANGYEAWVEAQRANIKDLGKIVASAIQEYLRYRIGEL